MARLGRRSGETNADDPRRAIVQAITRIRRDQAAVEARIGAAFADTATLTRATEDQRRVLREALVQIDAASAAAQHAADRAEREAGASAAAPYRQATAGFVAQTEVVDGLLAQLDRLGEGAADNLDRTRRLLRDSAAALDAALRAEVDLLGRVERLDRGRVIAETRARRHDHPGR